MSWRNTLPVTNAANRKWQWPALLQKDAIDALIGDRAFGVGFAVLVLDFWEFKTRRLKPAALGLRDLLGVHSNA